MSAKNLKALRPQTGSYGSVDTGGVVAVTEAEAKALLKTGNWAEATADDLKAAKKRQDAFVAAGSAHPVGPQFAHAGLSGPAVLEALRDAEDREKQLQADLDAALARVAELEAAATEPKAGEASADGGEAAATETTAEPAGAGEGEGKAAQTRAAKESAKV